MSTFLAIDFETANYSRTSACALGMVFVKNKRIVADEYYLIQPPQPSVYLYPYSWTDMEGREGRAHFWG